MLTAILAAPAILILFVLAVAFLVVLHRRGLVMLYAAANECDFRGDMLTMPAPAAANNGIGPNSGDPLMIGTGTSPSFGLALVAETSYTQPSGLVPTGNISVKRVGVFFLAVRGFNAPTGGSNHGFAPGDIVYASGGTYDATTGMWYGFVLCADPVNGVKYGIVLDPVVAGQTTTVRVMLKTAAG